MRRLGVVLLAAGLAAGCGRRPAATGPSVEAFTGRLTQNGKPVAFPAAGADTVQLTLFHEKGQSYGVPVKPDGSFTVGRMPVGQYSANLTHSAHGAGPAKAAAPYPVPGGLTIAGGRTDYAVELGRAWRP